MSEGSPAPGAEPALEVDLRSAVPPFEQIRAGVTALVQAGHLAPGAPLPSVRALAQDLGIAPGTVARAYRELEAAGVVRTLRGRGTRVADAPPTPAADEVRAALAQAVRAAVAAGWDTDRIHSAVRDELDARRPD